MRQTEQLIEASRQPEMGEALAQAVPAAITLGRLVQRAQQRREIDLGSERDIYVDQRQPSRRRRVACAKQRAPLLRFARLDLLGSALLDVGGCALATASVVAFENPIVVTKEPCPPGPAPRKILQSVESIGELMGFQHRARQPKLALFREHQGTEQVVSADRNIAFGEPLQENLRSLGIPIEERSGRGEQQEEAVAWLRSHRLFGP